MIGLGLLAVMTKIPQHIKTKKEKKWSLNFKGGKKKKVVIWDELGI